MSEQGFPALSSVLRANAEQVTEIHVCCTAHFVRSTFKINFTLFRPKCSLPLSKFGHNYKIQYSKYNPNVQFLCSSAYSNSPLPITLPSSMPNILPYVPTSFTRRTLPGNHSRKFSTRRCNKCSVFTTKSTSSSSSFSLERLINISP